MLSLDLTLRGMIFIGHGMSVLDRWLLCLADVLLYH